MTTRDISVAERLCGLIDASPTPFHAVDTVVGTLADAGARVLDERDRWPGGPGLFAVRRGGSLVAWRTSENTDSSRGFRVIGAHTDSPNLRLKPNPDRSSAGYRQLGVEVYGGVLLNSWLDRDLGLAGRVSVRTGAEVRDTLVKIDRPLLRIPQLAIHLDRDVNERGLVLNQQTHLSPLWAVGPSDEGLLARTVAEVCDVEPSAVLAWDLMLFDLQPSTLMGLDRELLSAPRIDNLVSCFLAADALIDSPGRGARVPVVCLFDHEEVGSVSSSGASSPLLGAVLRRISLGQSVDEEMHMARLADTMMLSADGAHATNPNYVERHDPDHRIELNGGPVLKVNASQRYATDSVSAAAFVTACEEAEVPLQRFVNRSDLACGSTIGPITASALGIGVVDAGCPQLAMHSARELAGSHDPAWFGAAMRRFLDG